MQRVRVLAFAAIASAILAGCQSAGSTTGSIVAYAPVADGAGLADGLAGTAVGNRLSAKDRRAALAAEYRALEYGVTGAPITWRGRSGRGEVIVGPPYRVNDYDCREYSHTITVKRRSETARGTACRGANGSWKPIA